MSSQSDAQERREAWVAAGAPDYAAPTRDESGGTTGYQSVAAQPMQQRSQDNWGLAAELARIATPAPAQIARPAPQQAAVPLAPTAPQQTAFPLAPQGQTGVTTQVPQRTQPSPITWGVGTPQAAQGLPGQALQTANATAGRTGPTDYGTLSELAARAFSVAANITVEKAREAVWQLPPEEKEALIARARTGEFNHLAPEIYPQGQQQQPGTSGQTPGVGRTGPMTQAEWEQSEYYARAQQGEAEKWRLELEKWGQEKARLEQELVLARNRDQRNQALLGIQQANQRLSEAEFQEKKLTGRATIAQGLLGTAASLKGPRDYPAFMKYLSGGRGIVQQLYGNQPRADFSAPTGAIEPMNIEYLMQQLGLAGGGSPVAAGNETLPLPYQIHPAVWDSLGQVGQQLVLGMAEQAGWDPNEFLRQLTAARPQGQAAQTTQYRYAAPSAVY